MPIICPYTLVFYSAMYLVWWLPVKYRIQRLTALCVTGALKTIPTADGVDAGIYCAELDLRRPFKLPECFSIFCAECAEVLAVRKAAENKN